MKKATRNKVIGLGIAKEFPEDVKYFKETSFIEELEIPSEKPAIEQLLSILVDATVISTKIVETPIAFSNEGQNLSGYKLLIELKLREKIKYISSEPSQPVHAIHFEKALKNIFVVIPNEIDGESVRDIYSRKKISITPYIEDIYGVKKDPRKIFKNITIFINVTFASKT